MGFFWAERTWWYGWDVSILERMKLNMSHWMLVSVMGIYQVPVKQLLQNQISIKSTWSRFYFDFYFHRNDDFTWRNMHPTGIWQKCFFMNYRDWMLLKIDSSVRECYKWKFILWIDVPNNVHFWCFIKSLEFFHFHFKIWNYYYNYLKVSISFTSFKL